jgi:RNA polymerase sigma-70 factor (ECF subfamily)
MENAPHVKSEQADYESSVTLVQKAQKGDELALDRLVRRYLPRLQRWATGRLPGYARSLADTQDIVQNALIGTIRHLGDFTQRGDGALLAYLRQAVLNGVRDEIRRAAARPMSQELSATIQASDESPLEAAMGRETFRRYEAALTGLDELEREAVIARLELGCSYDEVAQLLGKPSADAARMMVTRAVAKVAKAMSAPLTPVSTDD